jgi:putative endonuclease
MGERVNGIHEVGGSIPPGSTSLRSLRELRLGRPLVRFVAKRAKAAAPKFRRNEGGPPPGQPEMKYVYILESIEFEHFYVGITDDLRARLAKHNAGEVLHTSKYKPWQVKTYVAFADEKQAFNFEKYLKSASGRAFAKKRL